MENKKKKILIILGIFITVAVVVLGVILYNAFFNKGTDYDEFQKTDPPTQATQEPTDETQGTQAPTEPPTAANPIDFESLHEINEDAYAWITIPNTDIDYPILQSYSEDDFFYLDRNIYKQYEFAGSIFTEKLNTRDFDDPNTVVYGHNMLNGTMFQDLHNFRQDAFFEENEYIYVYTPDRKLTYHIFSAYVYDNRHILNSFDFTNEEVVAQYFEDCLNPRSYDQNVREGIELTTDDKIITLSTCIGDENYRLLVQGVLIKDEPTE